MRSIIKVILEGKIKRNLDITVEELSEFLEAMKKLRKLKQASIEGIFSYSF